MCAAGSEFMSSSQETEFWLVCPVCYKPNPAGTKNCKYCWGAALGGQKLVPNDQLEGVLHEHQLRVRRRRRTLQLAIAGSALVVLFLIVFPILRNYTDVLSPVPSTMSSNSLPGEWAMFRHDSLNTGAAGINDVLPQGNLKWSFTTGDAIHSSAAVSNGTVYFGSRNGKVYALDAETGRERWEFQTGSRVDSSPAVVGGRVYVGSNDGFLYALDASSGKQLWKFGTFYPVASSPSVADGKVFFGADDYHVYAVDAVRGTRIWRFYAGGPVDSSPVVANGLVYVASGLDFTYVLNASNGRPRLRLKTYDSSYGSVAVSGSTGMIGNYQSDFYVFNGDARNWPLEYELRPYWLQVWAFGFAPHPPPQSGLLWGMKLGHNMIASPTVQGDKVYVGVDQNLVAVDLQAKKKTWTFATQGTVSSSAAVAGGTLFVGSQDGHLYAVNSSDGKKVWDYETGGQITASPALVDGVIYVGSHDGKFYALK